MLKRILWVALAGCGVVIVALIIYLLPAHLEIRDVQPSVPEAKAFDVLKDADNKPIRVSAILTSSQHAPGRPIGHHSIVIEWADGRIFLIDAGMDESASMEFGRLLQLLWSAEPAQFHTTVFDAIGARAEQIAGIGFTHLHIDHTQALAAQCKGQPKFKIYQTADQHVLHNVNTRESAEILRTCPDATVIETDSLVPLEGFPGLGLLPLGGHTPGSTLFAVAVEDQLLLFSGDITNSKRDLLNDAGKGMFYSYLVVPEDTGRTQLLRGWLRDMDQLPNVHVLVSHDIEDMQALNKGLKEESS